MHFFLQDMRSFVGVLHPVCTPGRDLQGRRHRSELVRSLRQVTVDPHPRRVSQRLVRVRARARARTRVRVGVRVRFRVTGTGWWR